MAILLTIWLLKLKVRIIMSIRLMVLITHFHLKYFSTELTFFSLSGRGVPRVLVCPLPLPVSLLHLFFCKFFKPFYIHPLSLEIISKWRETGRSLFSGEDSTYKKMTLRKKTLRNDSKKITLIKWLICKKFKQFVMLWCVE